MDIAVRQNTTITVPAGSRVENANPPHFLAKGIIEERKQASTPKKFLFAYSKASPALLNLLRPDKHFADIFGLCGGNKKKTWWAFAPSAGNKIVISIISL